MRLREVAAHAGVALGTLYRRFRSKEDLLLAALEQLAAELETQVLERPAISLQVPALPPQEPPALYHLEVAMG